MPDHPSPKGESPQGETVNIDSELSKAREARQEGEVRRAGSLTRTLLAAHPQNPKVQAAVAELLWLEGHTDAALHVVSELLVEHSSSPTLRKRVATWEESRRLNGEIARKHRIPAVFLVLGLCGIVAGAALLLDYWFVELHEFYIALFGNYPDVFVPLGAISVLFGLIFTVAWLAKYRQYRQLLPPDRFKKASSMSRCRICEMPLLESTCLFCGTSRFPAVSPSVRPAAEAGASAPARPSTEPAMAAPTGDPGTTETVESPEILRPEIEGPATQMVSQTAEGEAVLSEFDLGSCRPRFQFGLFLVCGFVIPGLGAILYLIALFFFIRLNPKMILTTHRLVCEVQQRFLWRRDTERYGTGLTFLGPQSLSRHFRYTRFLLFFKRYFEINEIQFAGAGLSACSKTFVRRIPRSLVTPERIQAVTQFVAATEEAREKWMAKPI